jgi:hypothetical protein
MALTKVSSGMLGNGGGDIATNTALGTSALNSNTTGSANTALGVQALQTNTVAARNTVVGYQAAYFNNANDTVAVGSQAAYSNTTGASNTAIGKTALYSNTISTNNTAVGWEAGYTYNRTADSDGYNTFIGNRSGYSTTTGQVNTFLGHGSGNALTTGSYNTYVGSFSGNGSGLNLTTRSYNVALSMGNGSLRYLSLDMGAISTSPIEISANVGIGGLHFVTAYNLSSGAQGWWLVATRANSVTVVASSNNTGLTINFGQSGSVRLTMSTSSGSIAGNCHSWVDA